jgi:hypothetical protein
MSLEPTSPDTSSWRPTPATLPLPALLEKLGEPPPAELVAYWQMQLDQWAALLASRGWPLQRADWTELHVDPTGELFWPNLSEQIAAALRDQQSAPHHDPRGAGEQEEANAPVVSTSQYAASAPPSRDPLPVIEDLKQQLAMLGGGARSPARPTVAATENEPPESSELFSEVARAVGAAQPPRRRAKRPRSTTTRRGQRRRAWRRAAILTVIGLIATGCWWIASRPGRPTETADRPAEMDTPAERSTTEDEPAANTAAPALSQGALQTLREAGEPSPSVPAGAVAEPDIIAPAPLSWQSLGESGANSPLETADLDSSLWQLPAEDEAEDHDRPSPTDLAARPDGKMVAGETAGRNQPAEDAAMETTRVADPANRAPGDRDVEPAVGPGGVPRQREATSRPGNRADRPAARSWVALRFAQRRHEAVLRLPPAADAPSAARLQFAIGPPAEEPPDTPVTARWIVPPDPKLRRTDRGLLEVHHEGESPVRLRIRIDLRSGDSGVTVRWLAAATLEPALGYRSVTRESLGVWLGRAALHRRRAAALITATESAYDQTDESEMRSVLRRRLRGLEEREETAGRWLERLQELRLLLAQTESRLVLRLEPAGSR